LLAAMGLVKKDDAKTEEADAPEDPPIVKKLKEIDDKYLELEREYEKEVAKLEAEFKAKQQPHLEERKKILTAAEGDGPKIGTPALSGFWLKALQNHQAFGESDTIQEWDAPVLEYLVDIETSNHDDADAKKGFKLVFHFSENPYFTNTDLFKEYYTEEMNPYNGELVVKEIKASTIEWKAGKDVTVEKVAKKVKGGGAKKAKQKKEKEEPRPSFFREFFRSLAPGQPLSEDLKEELRGQLDSDEEDDGEDDDQMLEYIMDGDHDIGLAVRDQIIPFAVRFYTGEAVPDRDDDEDDEDDEDFDNDDDDDDSDDEPPVKGKGKGKGKKAPKKKESGDSADGKESKEKAEECKQQ